MMALSSLVRIEGSKTWEFRALHECEIIQDVKNLTDTCTVQLPQISGGFGKILPDIKRGDKISVALGYDGQLVTRFEGYIRRIDAKRPVKIECEDNMFLLKLAEAQKKSFAQVTLKQLIEHLLKGTGIVFKLMDDELQLGNYRIVKDTVAEELNELKREYGLQAYFIGPILYVGFSHPIESEIKNRQKFVFGKNIIEENFEYRRKEDIKLKVKAVSVLKDNKRITVETGDKQGELITVYAYDKDRLALKVFADAALEKYKYTGLQGNFLVFGTPVMNKVDIASITSSDENKGDYLVTKVTITFGQGGYRQKIELGQPLKVSDGTS